MKKLLVFLVLLISLDAMAQRGNEVLPLPDSLAGRLREFRKTDLSRAAALEAAIKYYYEKDRIQDAQGYINELAAIAEELKDNYYLASSDYYLAYSAMDRLDYEGAVVKLNSALERVELLRLTDRTAVLTAMIYLTKGNYYSKKTMFPESYEAVQQGLELVQGRDSVVYLKLINNLGKLYQDVGSVPEAERAFKEATKLRKFKPYINLAVLFCDQQQFDSSVMYIDSALSVAASVNDSVTVNHLRGAVCLRKNDLDEAEKCYQDCLRDLPYSTDVLLNSAVYQNASYIAMEKGELQQALSLVDTAIAYCQALHSVPRRLECLRLKAIILYKMGDYENSLDCMSEYSFKRDSMSVQLNQERFLQLVHQHETQQIERQYEAQMAIAKQRQQFLVVIAILIAVFTIVTIILLSKSKRQKEALLQQELDLRNREVTSKSINKIQSNEILNDAIKKLIAMEEHPENDFLPDIIRNLKTLVNDDPRKDFDLHFVQIHPDFYKKLLAEYPKLTQNELRLCAFIKSNLSVKEIASINGISAESVKTARKRLRKALNLTGVEVSLLEFLSKF